jgi:hypothetical protein
MHTAMVKKVFFMFFSYDTSLQEPYRQGPHLNAEERLKRSIALATVKTLAIVF